MEWPGFIKASKSYMNHPDHWKEWNAQLYFDNGDPDPRYPGWTLAGKRRAKLEFWRNFPRAWLRFHWDTVKCWVRRVLRIGISP